MPREPFDRSRRLNPRRVKLGRTQWSLAICRADVSCFGLTAVTSMTVDLIRIHLHRGAPASSRSSFPSPSGVNSTCSSPESGGRNVDARSTHGPLLPSVRTAG